MANEIIIIRVPNTAKYKALGYTVFRIDRQTPVGNPFPMHKQTQAERDRVCDAYQAYFNQKIEENNSAFKEYLRTIYKAHKDNKIALACWCAPKRCHGETIKQFIESFDN